MLNQYTTTYSHILNISNFIILTNLNNTYCTQQFNSYKKLQQRDLVTSTFRSSNTCLLLRLKYSFPYLIGWLVPKGTPFKKRRKKHREDLSYTTESSLSTSNFVQINEIYYKKMKKIFLINFQRKFKKNYLTKFEFCY